MAHDRGSRAGRQLISSRHERTPTSRARLLTAVETRFKTRKATSGSSLSQQWHKPTNTYTPSLASGCSVRDPSRGPSGALERFLTPPPEPQTNQKSNQQEKTGPKTSRRKATDRTETVTYVSQSVKSEPNFNFVTFSRHREGQGRQLAPQDSHSQFSQSPTKSAVISCTPHATFSSSCEHETPKNMNIKMQSGNVCARNGQQVSDEDETTR